MNEATPQNPHSPEAEAAVIGRCLNGGPKIAGQIVGTLLEAPHFYSPAFRLLYEAITEAYYADEPMDALTIGQLNAKKLAALWSTDENAAVERCRDLSDKQAFSGRIRDHAKLVKRASDYRLLLGLSKAMTEAVAQEDKAPEEIAGIVSTKAMRIATNALVNDQTISFEQLGEEAMIDFRKIMEAKEKGIELGVYTGLPFVDDYTHGIQPTEIWFCAGDPGAGKTAISWIAAMNFADRQMNQEPEKRIGTYVLSLEMGSLPTKMRLAQTLTGINSGRMRDGTMTKQDLQRIWDRWNQKRQWPLYFNFTSRLKASQMRALIVENIQRHNVGLVVIDHFRHFRMDERYSSQNQEDEDKVLFLKESIAKDLNVAVIVIAHTTKFSEQNHNRRPTMSNLRGSGMIAATADFIGFMYRPYNHATDDEKSLGEVRETDAEMIWEKNRFGEDDIAEFSFEPASMRVGPRLNNASAPTGGMF